VRLGSIPHKYCGKAELTRAEPLYLFCTCTGAFRRFWPIEYSKSFENSTIVADRLPPPLPLFLSKSGHRALRTEIIHALSAYPSGPRREATLHRRDAAAVAAPLKQRFGRVTEASTLRRRRLARRYRASDGRLVLIQPDGYLGFPCRA
jgi:hypothetical protein